MSKHVKVKPLEWGEPENYPPNSISGDRGGVCINTRETIVGAYSVYSVDGDRTFQVEGYGGVISRAAPTVEVAKSAAQADYESRILSALEPSPAFEAMVEALEAVDNDAVLIGRGDEAVSAAALAKVRAALALARGER